MAALACLSALSIGCASLRPNLAPSPTPGATATQTPTSAPSPRPTPTWRPTESSPSADAAPTDVYGTFVEVLSDSLDDSGSGFPTGDFPTERVVYQDGSLVLSLKAASRSTWSMREFGDWPLTETAATMIPLAGADAGADAGFLGLTCGRTNDDFYAALISTEGTALLLRYSSGAAAPLAELREAIAPPASDTPLELRLTCVGAEAGTQPALALAVDDVPVIAALDPQGFGSFRRGGFYAESGAAPEGFGVAAEGITVRAGLRAAPAAPLSPSPSTSITGDPGGDLLALHVPLDLRPACSVTEAAVAAGYSPIVAIDCATGGPTQTLYLQYADSATMNAQYGEVMDAHPEATGPSCAVSAGEGPYTVDGVDVGRLLCFTDDGMARLIWTDERLNILADATWPSESFAELYAWWGSAGPVP